MNIESYECFRCGGKLTTEPEKMVSECDQCRDIECYSEEKLNEICGKCGFTYGAHRVDNCCPKDADGMEFVGNDYFYPKNPGGQS